MRQYVTVIDASMLESRLNDLNRSQEKPWQLLDGKLHKQFVFRDFSDAFAFMTRVALAAEKADHHPDWCNAYNRVDINLVTHQSGGLTEKDFTLAHQIDQLTGTAG